MNMEEFARDVLIECIKDGDISAAQKALKMIEERGLEVTVKRKDITENT